MLYLILSDLVMILHLAFVIFVVCGGVLLLRWPRVMRLHLPAAIWGAVVEFTGWICPLTPLENWLRAQTGEAAYEGDFVLRFLLPMLYPEALTHDVQVVLGVLVLVVNLAIYSWLWQARRRP
ncbi:MAG: DUF2784 domain-containing protein [Nitrospirota bacterium]|nr:DUF2784 domain-containing protein [Nitrospirota bacterium]